MKYDWIKDIPEYQKQFPPEIQKLIEFLGIEKYMEVHSYFAKTSVYFSDVPINSLKKMWAVKNKNVPYNEAARTLNVSVTSIYNWREKTNDDNLDLFEGHGERSRTIEDKK